MRARSLRPGCGLALAAAFTLSSPSAAAKDPIRPGFHPAIEVLDIAGLDVARGGSVPEAVNTCGACHDAGFIADNDTHGLEVPGADCFTCHVESVDDWTPEAFDPDGRLRRERAKIRRASDGACGGCHGLVPPAGQPVAIPEDYAGSGQADGGWRRYDLTKREGAVFSGARISESYLNIADREVLTLPWDIHASRKLGCTDCHHAANNPARSELKTGKLAHLRRDPRLPAISEYLSRPDHRLTSDRCERCHDPMVAHEFLPQRERHLEILECQSCHVPRVYGPALAWEDATVVTPREGALREIRGMNPGSGPINSRLLAARAPHLFAFKDETGETMVGPFNMAPAGSG